MTNPAAILCPGQGAQAVGMGSAWAAHAPEARAVFTEADAQLGSRLGSPLSTLCFEGPADRLNQTDVSQPAIFATSIACWRAILARNNAGNGEYPLTAALGLSLGEYTALHIAGAISFKDALELVTLRGRAMQDAAEASPGGMVALIGADEAQAQAVCDAARGNDVLVCANFNAPGQIVISGSKPACERSLKAAADLSLRAQALPVAGAFHSPLMAAAADRLRAALDKTPISAPRCPVIANVTAMPHIAEHGRDIAGSIRARLVEQLTSPVRWAQSCQYLIAHHPGAELLEVAPGKSLAGLMRRIDKGAKVTSFDLPA